MQKSRGLALMHALRTTILIREQEAFPRPGFDQTTTSSLLIFFKPPVRNERPGRQESLISTGSGCNSMEGNRRSSPTPIVIIVGGAHAFLESLWLQYSPGPARDVRPRFPSKPSRPPRSQEAATYGKGFRLSLLPMPGSVPC